MPLLSNEVKRLAIEHFVRRRKAAAEHGHVNNQDLYAGQPCIFYCKECGIFLEKLPEDYLFQPLQTCSQCLGLREHGWLEEAKREVRTLSIPVVQTGTELKNLGDVEDGEE